MNIKLSRIRSNLIFSIHRVNTPPLSFCKGHVSHHASGPRFSKLQFVHSSSKAPEQGLVLDLGPASQILSLTKQGQHEKAAELCAGIICEESVPIFPSFFWTQALSACQQCGRTDILDSVTRFLAKAPHVPKSPELYQKLLYHFFSQDSFPQVQSLVHEAVANKVPLQPTLCSSTLAYLGKKSDGNRAATALLLFDFMRSRKMALKPADLSWMLKACVALKKFDLAMGLAKRLMERPDEIKPQVWTQILKAADGADMTNEIQSILKAMEARGHQPNAHHVRVILRHLVRVGRAHECEQYWELANRLGMEFDESLCVAFLECCVASGNVAFAREIERVLITGGGAQVQQQQQGNAVSTDSNAMPASANHENQNETNEAARAPTIPYSPYVFRLLIETCGLDGDSDRAKYLFRTAYALGSPADALITPTLFSVLFKCGDNAVFSIFDRMVARNHVFVEGFNAMIRGCVDLGQHDRAWRYFDQMTVVPNHQTFSILMESCARTNQMAKAAFVVSHAFDTNHWSHSLFQRLVGFLSENPHALVREFFEKLPTDHSPALIWKLFDWIVRENEWHIACDFLPFLPFYPTDFTVITATRDKAASDTTHWAQQFLSELDAILPGAVK